ncbi:MAG: MOSC domain-containing protein [Gemmatimonadaceae bacterium]|jgi:MOSC domain-containing protein YiiM
MSEQGVIVSINVSSGGVPKLPVPEAHASPSGLDGDGQRDRRHHGGPDRALCLFSMERIEALQREGHAIAPGTTGENLTIRGLDWDTIAPGVQLRAGGVTMDVTAYASPCKSIRPSFADENSNRISQQKHPGWSRVYARVVVSGELRVGDAVVPGPSIHAVGD